MASAESRPVLEDREVHCWSHLRVQSTQPRANAGTNDLKTSFAFDVLETQSSRCAKTERQIQRINAGPQRCFRTKTTRKYGAESIHYLYCQLLELWTTSPQWVYPTRHNALSPP